MKHSELSLNEALGERAAAIADPEETAQRHFVGESKNALET